jgi:hypothetical protein
VLMVVIGTECGWDRGGRLWAGQGKVERGRKALHCDLFRPPDTTACRTPRCLLWSDHTHRVCLRRLWIELSACCQKHCVRRGELPRACVTPRALSCVCGVVCLSRLWIGPSGATSGVCVQGRASCRVPVTHPALGHLLWWRLFETALDRAVGCCCQKQCFDSVRRDCRVPVSHTLRSSIVWGHLFETAFDQAAGRSKAMCGGASCRVPVAPRAVNCVWCVVCLRRLSTKPSGAVANSSRGDACAHISGAETHTRTRICVYLSSVGRCCQQPGKMQLV